MFPLLIPMLAFGAFVYFATGRHGAPPERRTSVSGSVPPSPLSVLEGCLRTGQQPPPPVILCAIAEAESSGQRDLAEHIVRMFIAPVVRAHEAQVALSAWRSPRWGFPSPAAQAPAARPLSYAPAPSHGYGSARPGAGAASPTYDDATADMSDVFYASSIPPSVQIIPSSDDTEDGSRAATPQTQAPSNSPSARASTRSPNAGTVTVSGKSSPIEGVDTRDWARFVDSVSREIPAYMSDRHVGQFRQRRSRLSELGIDPASLTSPEAQYAALDVDMADAYAHARDSELVQSVCGSVIQVPGKGAAQVTLSGIMGVIQAAGLVGAVDWFEKPSDRKRFANTTRAFVRTNGVF